MQVVAIDLSNWMWTFARGAMGIKLRGMFIKYEILAIKSCAKTYNLMWDKWLKIDDW
jgi:hypothetical protein